MWNGWRRTEFSKPYNTVGKMMLLRTLTLVRVCILCWCYKMHESDWKADEALQILELISVSILQSSCTMLSKYWKWETTLIGSPSRKRWIGTGFLVAGSSGGRTAKDLVFMQLIGETQLLTTCRESPAWQWGQTSCWPEGPCRQRTPGQSLTYSSSSSRVFM